MSGARLPLGGGSRPAAAPSRRRTGACVRSISRVRPGCLQQAGVEGRHTHHRGRLGQRDEHLIRRRTSAGTAWCRRTAVNVLVATNRPWMWKIGQGVEQDIVGREAPGLDQRRRVGGKIAVGEHRAFGAPRGAGGVEDGGKVVPAERGICKAAVLAMKPLPSACRHRQFRAIRRALCLYGRPIPPSGSGALERRRSDRVRHRR